MGQGKQVQVICSECVFIYLRFFKKFYVGGNGGRVKRERESSYQLFSNCRCVNLLDVQVPGAVSNRDRRKLHLSIINDVGDV